MTTRTWQGRWINAAPQGDLKRQVLPAPYLRSSFHCETPPQSAWAYLCTPGYHEIYLNGQKVDTRVLAPAPSEFDKHVSYVAYDLKPLLKTGRNAITVLLGNGWYNCHTPGAWGFEHAAWRDWPKLLCDIEVDGKVIECSNNHWKTHPSPIVFDGLRSGEFYDARLEIPGVTDAGFDDSCWQNAAHCYPPGGLLTQEEMEPCQVTTRYDFCSETVFTLGRHVYDFGVNLAGWCEITLEAPAGVTLYIQYAEMVRDNMDIDREYIANLPHGAIFQEDRYTAKGGGVETWHPRFTYHGFRYVKIRAEHPEVKIHKLQACFIHNAFLQHGSFDSSHPTLNQLQKMTRQSFLSNFVGIPTDCPHREKNGWTGDVSVAFETGLWNYSAANAYRHFLQILVDTQRANGQLACIAPSGGWGYNWGSGPAWDSLLFVAADQLYRFTGNDDAATEFYQPMKRYLAFCESMANDDLVNFGLGDWCPVEHFRMTPVEITSSCYYYFDACKMAEFARRLQLTDDQNYYEALAKRIRNSCNRKFYHGNGIYGDDSWTALSAAVYFNICPEEARTAIVARLVDKVRANAHKVDFGILGAKYVPRILSDFGYIDDALELIVQPEYPGWGNWVRQGATTLWETWSGMESRNHVMFGDISAWMYQYPGGMSPLEPGFKRVRFAPSFAGKLDFVHASYQSVHGLITSSWRRNGDQIECDFRVPSGCTGVAELPGMPPTEFHGEIHFCLPCKL